MFLQTYVKFIRGHALVHLLSPVDAPLGRSGWFDLALSSAALLRVGWWGRFSPHKVYLTSGMAEFWPKIFNFTRCVVRHLGYLLPLDYQPCPIWTPWGLARFFRTRSLVGPWSVLEVYIFYFTFFIRFIMGLQSVTRNCTPQDSLGDPLVSEGVRRSYQGSSIFGGSNGALDPVIPSWQGLCHLIKLIVLGLSCSCAKCPGKCAPWTISP